MKVPTLPARLPGMLNYLKPHAGKPGPISIRGGVTQLGSPPVCMVVGMANMASLCHTVSTRYPPAWECDKSCDKIITTPNCQYGLLAARLWWRTFQFEMWCRTTGGLVPSRRWTFRGLIHTYQPASISVSGTSREYPPRTNTHTHTHTYARRKNLHHISTCGEAGVAFPKKPH